MTDTPETKRTPEEKLDEVVEILRRMDGRDRLRMVGGTIRSVIAFIPVIILVWSTWYLAAHGTQLIQQITEATIKSTMKGSGSSVGSDTLQQLLQSINGVKVK